MAARRMKGRAGTGPGSRSLRAAGRDDRVDARLGVNVDPRFGANLDVDPRLGANVDVDPRLGANVDVDPRLAANVYAGGSATAANESLSTVGNAFLRPIPVEGPAARSLLMRRRASRPDVEEAVRAVVNDVQARGDSALREATRRLDGVDLPDPFLSAKEWAAAAASVPTALRRAIDRNLARIRAFHRLQRRGPESLTVAPGVKLGRKPVPFRAVACYVPGGRASYPSTACMTVVPAAIAGVAEIIVVTPPLADGSVDAAVCYAARKAGATRILRAGGAQAVAAVAFGTRRIPRVDAVVGPGNAYVTEAKRRVHGEVWTDAPAGPSELVIVADGTASPQEVALDLMAQAEHDPDAQVILVTTSKALAAAVRAEILRRLPTAHRRDVVEASLRDHGALLVAVSLPAALAFSEEYAPEHLTLMVQDPAAAFARVRNAGSVFLGRHAPVSLGDYGSGTNHVLPTMGQARIRGGLSVEDFRKWITWQEVTAEGLAAIGPDIALVARAEGLVAHAHAVEERLAAAQDPTDRGRRSGGKMPPPRKVGARRAKERRTP